MRGAYSPGRMEANGAICIVNGEDHEGNTFNHGVNTVFYLGLCNHAISDGQ